MLQQVSKLPGCASNREGENYVAHDVREFLRQGNIDVAIVTIKDRSPKNVCASLKRYVSKHPEQCKGIGVAFRNGKAYLYRKEVS